MMQNVNISLILLLVTGCATPQYVYPQYEQPRVYHYTPKPAPKEIKKIKKETKELMNKLKKKEQIYGMDY